MNIEQDENFFVIETKLAIFLASIKGCNVIKDAYSSDQYE